MDKTKIAVDIFSKYASLYQERFMNVDLYSDGLDQFCDLVENNGDVLELACGPGNVTKYILDKRPDLKILGTDLSENMLELARENNPNAVFSVMDCRDIAKLGKTYDAIIAAFCLPYVSKEEAIQMITDASKKLNPKGLLYLSTMEDSYNNSGWKAGSKGDEMYMHFHEAEYLTKALQSNGLSQIGLSRKNYMDHTNKPVCDLMILTQKSGKPA